MGRYEEARRYGEEARQFPATPGYEYLADAARRLLGSALLELGDLDAARGHIQEALVLARESGASRRISMSLSLLGELHRTEGDLFAAGLCYEEALALDRERGARADIAGDLCNLAATLIGRKSIDSVFPLLREALALTLEIGDQFGGCFALEAAAGLGAVVGESTFAARLYAAGERHLEQIGGQQGKSDQAFFGPLIAKTREALGESAFAATERGGRALSYEEAMTEARAWLADRDLSQR
jgi:tetratricopeptide (TPR) repeat protein